MSKHDIKGRNLQIDNIETLEEAKVIIRSILSYSEAFVLAGTDLVYADWVNDRIAEGGGFREPESDDSDSFEI